MSGITPLPALEVLGSEPAGFCEPGSDYCEVPGLGAEAPETTDQPSPTATPAEDRARADLSRPTPLSS